MLFWTFFITGFSVGFGHCIGMCGPIVVSLSLSLKEKPLWLPHLLYNAGRVTTYGLLGTLMGFTGSFTGTAARLAGVQQFVMIFTGVLIAVMGLMMGGWLPIGRLFQDNCDSPGFIQKGFQKLSHTSSPASYLPLGLLLGLLPCGPVYTALIAAARAGMESSSHWRGAVTGMSLMGAFGLGTIPAMLLVARLASMGWLTKRHLLYRFSAMIMVLMGIIFIYKGIRW
ncbi:MAG: sulfite exporter TauE/SafE family protein [Desulfobacterales bacterium]|nr:sulfite exporter TauE/SafE family protein [Desulfobacterales bacterium]